jgi:hypothetical protein
VKVDNLIRICFTEIRLSQAQTHANRYGKLGIGFIRDFIMDKGGRPVIYTPFNLVEDGSLLEDSLRNIFNKAEDYEDLKKPISLILAYTKRMSNKIGDKNKYYEEMEWRLVHDGSPNNKHFTKGKDEGEYRLKFKPSDVKVIIFPDEDIMKMSLKDETIKKHFSEHMPNIVTLEDCGNF